MLSKLTSLSKPYWVAIIVAGLSMEAVALYFQYGLDYGPCVLCVHIRAWILALMLIAVIGLFIPSNRSQLVPHILSLGAAAGLAERSWITLGVERGTIEGSCTMDSGYPTWLPLDQWLPVIFEPWEPCGYTPELISGITMAEGLIAFSALLILAVTIQIIAALKSVNA